MKFRSRRQLTEFKVVLLTEDSERQVEVLDVSDQGVRIRTPSNIELEDEVVMEFRGRQFPGRVAWADGGEVGLQFDLPLPSDVQTLIAREKRSDVSRRRFLFR